jgi:MFS family permease
MDILDSTNGKAVDASRISCAKLHAQINGSQFIPYLFLGPETRYLRRGVEHHGSDFKQEYFTFKRIDPSQLSWWEFVMPLHLAKYPCVVIPTVAYSVMFLFGSVLVTVEIPQLFGEKFHFNTEQLGLQFLGIIIGSVIGEQIGGALSDQWMNRRSRKVSARPPAEFRLWLSHVGFLLTIAGVAAFLIRIEQAPEGHWNVTPIIGAAIAGAGNQIVTTVLITYAVDCYHEEAASIGFFVTFVRQTLGFTGPFW